MSYYGIHPPQVQAALDARTPVVTKRNLKYPGSDTNAYANPTPLQKCTLPTDFKQWRYTRAAEPQLVMMGSAPYIPISARPTVPMCVSPSFAYKGGSSCPNGTYVVAYSAGARCCYPRVATATKRGMDTGSGYLRTLDKALPVFTDVLQTTSTLRGVPYPGLEYTTPSLPECMNLPFPKLSGI